MVTLSTTDKEFSVCISFHDAGRVLRYAPPELKISQTITGFQIFNFHERCNHLPIPFSHQRVQPPIALGIPDFIPFV